MKICSVIVLKSTDGIDEYYIDMAIKSLLPYVSGIYVQDQGCIDNTIKVIRDTVKAGPTVVPLIIEHVLNPHPRFSLGYDECLYRNMAIARCEELFPDAEWLLQNDADDLFTPYFFETIAKMEAIGHLEGINSIFYATERFITPEMKSGWRGDLVEFGGKYYHDPHNKVWRSSLKVRYPEKKDGQFHNVPVTDMYPVKIIEGICNIHLHRSFGPKAFSYWAQAGDVFEKTIPFNPRKQAPKLFTDPQNMGSAVSAGFEWPEYILYKWAQWGDLDYQRRNYK